MSNTRDVLLEYMRRVDQAWNTADTPRIDDLLSRLETPCSSSHSPQKLNGIESSAPSSRSCSHGSVDTTLDESHATDPLAAARALMAGRGVRMTERIVHPRMTERIVHPWCGYYLHDGNRFFYNDKWNQYSPSRGDCYESESAAILAWLEAEKEKQYDPYIRSAYTRQLRNLIAAIRPAAEVKRSNFVPLETETHLHDMLVGPCKCGAWLEAEQAAAKPQPAGYSVDDERILVQWRDADGYDHSITIDADEAVYRIDADGIHEFIREWPLPKQPAEPDLPMCIAELEDNTHD